MKDCKDCYLFGSEKCSGKMGTDGSHIFDCKNCAHGDYYFPENAFYCDCECVTEGQCKKRFITRKNKER